MVWQSEQGPRTIATTDTVETTQKKMLMIKIIIYFTKRLEGIRKKSKATKGHFT